MGYISNRGRNIQARQWGIAVIALGDFLRNFTSFEDLCISALRLAFSNICLSLASSRSLSVLIILSYLELRGLGIWSLTSMSCYEINRGGDGGDVKLWWIQRKRFRICGGLVENQRSTQAVFRIWRCLRTIYVYSI